MSKLSICPQYVWLASPPEFANILMRIPQTSNSFKLVVDSELEILNRYRAQDKYKLVAAWIEFLINLEGFGLYRVKLASDASKLTNEELALNLALAIDSDRKIIVDDSASYHKFLPIIIAGTVNLYDRANADKAFKVIAPFDFQKLTEDILKKAHLMVERRVTEKIEDLHNDKIVDFLRDNCEYNIGDQTRAGASGSGKGAGELDMAVRYQNGVIHSIIEALRLSSCGDENTTVAAHIDKLINNYDVTGSARNFIIVYAESQDFSALWDNYKDYVSKINSNAKFNSANCPLNSFDDVSNQYQCQANVRIAKAIHKRRPVNLEVMHIFIKIHK